MEKHLQENKEDDLELDFERICILYANVKLGYFGVILSVSFLGFIVSRLITPKIAVIWAIAVFVSYIPRAILSIIFKRKLDKQEITPVNIGTWENYFFLNTLIPFACFTAVVFLPYKENTFLGILFCAVTMISMIAGGSLVYSTSKRIILLFLNITFLSLIIKSFWMQDIIYTALGCYMIIGYIFLTTLILRQNRLFMENIALKIENRNQSFIDPLTKLWNRRRLYLFIDKMIELSKRSGDPFSLIMLDIDHFKQYNDAHGHNAGDNILIKISKILLDCSREQDLVVRYGGEEFMVVLPNTNIGQAEIIAERIQTSVRKNADVTISGGLAQYADQTDFDQMVHEADKALYIAKNNGRDRFIVATAN